MIALFGGIDRRLSKGPLRHWKALICAAGLLLSTCLMAAAGVVYSNSGRYVWNEDEAQLVFEPTPSEEYFSQILSDLCERDVAACSAGGPTTRQPNIETVGREIERVVGKLVDLSERDDELVRSMRAALEVKNIMGFTRERSNSGRLLEHSDSVWGALVRPVPESGPIVRRTLQIDVGTLRGQFQDDFVTRLPSNDRRIWLDASNELLSKRTAEPGETPEFMLTIPVIGQELIEMKRKCEPIYHAIDLIRHSHAYFKLWAAEAEARLFEDHALVDELREKTSSTRRLISRAGANMFQTLVERVLIGALKSHYKVREVSSIADIKKEHRTECMIRLFYAVFSQIVSFESKCSQKP